MMGFTGIVITEALAGKSVLEVNHFSCSCILFVCVMTLCWDMLVCVVSVPHITTCGMPAVLAVLYVICCCLDCIQGIARLISIYAGADVFCCLFCSFMGSRMVLTLLVFHDCH